LGCRSCPLCNSQPLVAFSCRSRRVHARSVFRRKRKARLDASRKPLSPLPEGPTRNRGLRQDRGQPAMNAIANGQGSLMSFGRQNYTEAELLRRVAAWPDYCHLQNLTAVLLEDLTRQHGVDFATALLFEHFQRSGVHGKFIQRINALRGEYSIPRSKVDARVVIVPGALYRERPAMGGDGRLVREVAHNFGLQTDLIPIASLGCVTKNAESICAWLEDHFHEQILLVSLSKGGSDVKLALGSPDAPHLFRNVVAWVNVCGPLNGSRMANWILASRVWTWFFRFKFWCQKRDFGFITEMRHGPGGPLAAPLCLPPSMRMITVIGFPLKQHMTSRLSRSCHRTLAQWGPTDGTTSLSDLVGWPGDVYPAWEWTTTSVPKPKRET
jgi:hypothetical protein